MGAAICALCPLQAPQGGSVPPPHHPSRTLSDGPRVRPVAGSVRRQKRRPLARTAFRVCLAPTTSPFALTATVQPPRPDAPTLPVSKAGP